MNVIVHHFCRFSTKTLLFLCPSTEFSFFDGSEKFFQQIFGCDTPFQDFLQKNPKKFSKNS